MIRFFLLLFLPIFASNIPIYLLDSQTSREVTLDNQTVFNAIAWSGLLPPIWDMNDEILLEYKENLFPGYQTVLVVKNVSKNNSFAVATILSSPQMGSLSIVSINAATEEVVLNDGSIWKVISSDAKNLSYWDVGNSILLGENYGVERFKYDAVLINVTKNLVAKAHEN